MLVGLRMGCCRSRRANASGTCAACQSAPPASRPPEAAAASVVSIRRPWSCSIRPSSSRC